MSSRFFRYIFIIAIIFIAPIFFIFNSSLGIVDIQSGEGLRVFAKKMKVGGFIKSDKIFLFYCKVFYKLRLFSGFKAGEYQIDKNENLLSFLKKIENGQVVLRGVTFPEGITNFEFIEILNHSSHFNEQRLKYNSEMFLMPDTYSYAKGESRAVILDKSQAEMESFLDQAWNKLDNEKKQLLGSRKNLYILASIVEKEVAAREEGVTVASVYLNRIRIGMKLQADPTVIYAMTEGKVNIGRRLTFKDLNLAHPCNTYKNYGLPPLAIAVPSRDSIMDIVNERRTDYLFFVKKPNEKYHIFTKDYLQHVSNAKGYRSEAGR